MSDSAARRVASTTAVQVAGKAAVLLIGAASVVVLTRYLGAAGYGKLSLAFAYTQAFGVLADVGLVTVAVRELSRSPERTEELVGDVLAIRLALALVVIALAGAISLALPYTPDVRWAILLAGAPLLLGLANGALVAPFQARLRMGGPAAAETAGRAASFAGAVVVAVLDLGFYAVILAAAAGALVTLAITWTLTRRVARVRPSFSPARWRPLLAASLPVGIALALNEVYFRVDMLIVSLYRPYEEVGLYGLAFRVLELAATFPGVFLLSVFPVLAAWVAAGDPRVPRAVQAASDAFVAVGAPLALGGLVLAPDVVELVGGSGFAGAADPLRLLLFAAALSFVNGLLGYALIAGDRQRQTLWLNVVALVLNVALNLALVPRYGIDAAAATAVGSELAILAGSWWLMHRYLGFFPRVGALPRALVAAGAMTGALWLARDASLAVLAPLAPAVYLPLLYALGGIDRTIIARVRG